MQHSPAVHHINKSLPHPNLLQFIPNLPQPSSSTIFLNKSLSANNPQFAMGRSRSRRSNRPVSAATISPTASPRSSVDSDIVADYISNIRTSESPAASPSASPLIPSLPTHPDGPEVSAMESIPSLSPLTPAASSSSADPPPHPIFDNAMQFYDLFSQPSPPRLYYKCTPMQNGSWRRSLHLSAEFIGAKTQSEGTKKQRVVVISWPYGKRIPVKRAVFERAVLRIMDENVSKEEPAAAGSSRGRGRGKVSGSGRGKGRGRGRGRGRVGDVGGRQMQRMLAKGLQQAEARIDRVLFPAEAQPATAASSSENEGLGDDNVGFNMLRKMGWNEGNGLGADGEGRVDPVDVQKRRGRLGIGAD